MNVAAPDMPPDPPRRRPPPKKEQPGYLVWWLCLALFFEYARPANFVPGLGALPLNSLIPLGLFVVCLFNGSLRSFGDIYQDRSARWVSLYMFLIFISVFWSEVHYTSSLIFEVSLGYFFLFIIFARVLKDEADMLKVVGALVVAHIFLLIMNFNVITDPSQRQYIVGGTFLGDGNDYSMSLVLLLPMAVEQALRAKTLIPRGIYWGMIGLILLAIVASQSRGAVLGILGTAIFLWWNSKNKMQGIVIAAVLTFGLMLYAPSVFFSRMNTISEYETEGSAQGRIQAWKGGMRMIMDKPLTGVSVGMFAVSYGTKYKPKGEWVHWMNAHSMYFQVIGELGVPGTITLLAILIGNVISNVKLRRRYLAFYKEEDMTPEQQRTSRLLLMGTASVIGFCIAGAFLSTAYYPHIFVLTGLLVAFRSMVSKTLPPDPALAARGRGRKRKPAAFSAP
jgi:probable O-glycosylation ligase (exosortase A-associated)